MSESRLYGADFMRAAACFTVLFHHLAERMSDTTALGPIEWFRFFELVGTFGVAMFFVLSGYLLSRPFWQALDGGQPMPSLRTYALRRAARILPGYWLALSITFVLSFTVFAGTPYGTGLDGVLALRFIAGFLLLSDWSWVTLFPVEVNGPLWSISFEVTSYVLLPLGFIALFALTAASRWRYRMLWLAVIALAVGLHIMFLMVPSYPGAFVAAGRLVNEAYLYWVPRYNAFSFFAMFAVGALSGGVQVMFARQRSAIFDLLSVGALVLGALLFWRQAAYPVVDGTRFLGIPYDFPWFVAGMGLILAVTPQSVVVGRVLDNALVRFLARISFGIYVWHYVVLELVHLYVNGLFVHGGDADPGRFVLTSLAVTGITIAVATASFHLIEQPVIRWARGLERRGTPVSARAPA